MVKEIRESAKERNLLNLFMALIDINAINLAMGYHYYPHSYLLLALCVPILARMLKPIQKSEKFSIPLAMIYLAVMLTASPLVYQKINDILAQLQEPEYEELDAAGIVEEMLRQAIVFETENTPIDTRKTIWEFLNFPPWFSSSYATTGFEVDGTQCGSGNGCLEPWAPPTGSDLINSDTHLAMISPTEYVGENTIEIPVPVGTSLARAFTMDKNGVISAIPQEWILTDGVMQGIIQITAYFPDPSKIIAFFSPSDPQTNMELLEQLEHLSPQDLEELRSQYLLLIDQIPERYADAREALRSVIDSLTDESIEEIRLMLQKLLTELSTYDIRLPRTTEAGFFENQGTYPEQLNIPGLDPEVPININLLPQGIGPYLMTYHCDNTAELVAALLRIASDDSTTGIVVAQGYRLSADGLHNPKHAWVVVLTEDGYQILDFTPMLDPQNPLLSAAAQSLLRIAGEGEGKPQNTIAELMSILSQIPGLETPGPQSREIKTPQPDLSPVETTDYYISILPFVAVTSGILIAIALLTKVINQARRRNIVCQGVPVPVSDAWKSTFGNDMTRKVNALDQEGKNKLVSFTIFALKYVVCSDPSHTLSSKTVIAHYHSRQEEDGGSDVFDYKILTYRQKDKISALILNYIPLLISNES